VGRDLAGYAWLSIAAALVTIGTKSVAAWITDSVSLFSDAAESIINLVAALAMLLALRVAAKPPDLEHQYGHTKAEYLSSALEGMMIFVAAGAICYAAISRLFSPVMPERLGSGMVISVVAAVINAVVAVVLLRAGQRHNSIALLADGKHLLTDIVTTGAVLLGVALVMLTGKAWLDPVVALIAGVNIAWTGFGVIRSSADSLLDRALPAADLGVIDDVLVEFQQQGVRFHGLRTRGASARRFLDVHVVVPGEWTILRGHELADQVESRLREQLPGLTVVTHIEPDEPECPDVTE
jgi:cation diffusion facilitator family transporter